MLWYEPRGAHSKSHKGSNEAQVTITRQSFVRIHRSNDTNRSASTLSLKKTPFGRTTNMATRCRRRAGSSTMRFVSFSSLQK